MIERRITAAAAVLGIALPGLAACGAARVSLALVAYSTPQAAYEQLIKAFQATPAGKNVRFTKSFGASGDQSRAVEAGLKADIVAFSLEPDMTRLVKAGLVAEDWKSGPSKGMITDSVAVIATRKGNPKGLKSWDDLTKSGDEIIAYENEAIFAQQNKQELEYTIPDATILIENPIAIAKKSEHPTEAKAFLDFLYSAQGQKIFADNGYRPVIQGGVPGVSFPAPAQLFTIADLGGWTKVNKDFFDPSTGIMADIERSLGVSVDKK